MLWQQLNAQSKERFIAMKLRIARFLLSRTTRSVFTILMFHTVNTSMIA